MLQIKKRIIYVIVIILIIIIYNNLKLKIIMPTTKMEVKDAQRHQHIETGWKGSNLK